jgi:hypothetical protein
MFCTYENFMTKKAFSLELFAENNDNKMKKIRIRSLTCRHLVYSKRSISKRGIKKSIEALGGG